MQGLWQSLLRKTRAMPRCQLPLRIHASSCRNGHDPTLAKVTHAALRADEQLWRSLRFVGLSLVESQLFEVRVCPDCNAELRKPVGAAMALRMLMGRLGNQNVSGPVLDSVQVLAQWAERVSPTRDKAMPESKCQGGDRVCIRIGTPLAEAEHQLVMAVLSLCAGNRSESAKLLGLSRRTLYNKLQSLKKRRLLTEPLPPPRWRKQQRTHGPDEAIERAPTQASIPALPEDPAYAERAQPQR